MDKNTVKGAVKDVVGKGKEGLGKATGNTRLEADGKADQVEGKAQKAVGNTADAARKAVKP